ncbi:MAG: hypothetical protein M1829_002295 [Trizodia sp. TS-e1964]|nr:MAG: hypothetical protein M1829_002295 [Trizodia sp. TS-e1964]
MLFSRPVTVLVVACVLAVGIVMRLLAMARYESEMLNSFSGGYQRVPPTKGVHEDEAAYEGQGDSYLLGVGKADITGPVVELNLMGYADANQVGTGLRQRLYARTFIVGSVTEPASRFVYIVLDIQSGDTAVRYGVLDGLLALGPEYGVYGPSNVAVTGTHSHSGPGAWVNYLLPQITSKGFDRQSYNAIVDGTVLSVKRAHESLARGYLDYAEGEVLDANVNRSPFSYLANPVGERDRYAHDVDKTLSMLRFRRARDGKDMGVLTWFPVHGTSMLGNNTLISGDNKGVAARLLEQALVGSDHAADGFVAGFSQSNVGDTSPNVLGAFCEDGTGLPCKFEDSTCGGKNQGCHARGPFFRVKDEGAASCFEIGRRQYKGAKDLYDSVNTLWTPIKGPSVKSLHTFQDFSNFSFPLPHGSTGRTCAAALGYSFAAGTSDGHGAFDFKQNNPGAPDANPLWAVVGGMLHAPDEAQKACHAPKPILLDVGEVQTPYLWTPNIVDIQLLRVGQFIIIVSPGEATTMAGRRWKEAIGKHAVATEVVTDNPPIVVLGGPANTYTHYITTEEEYGIQRYEGASTLYGPHTLAAHIFLTKQHLPLLHAASTRTADPGPQPPNNANRSLSFITGVLFDQHPWFQPFGAVVSDVLPSYLPLETARATFVGANPRNNLRLEGTYVAVERKGPYNNAWTAVRTDADWTLLFRWVRTSTLLGRSEVSVEWAIEEDVDDGVYRLRYYGDAKHLSGRIVAFEGASAEFEVKRRDLI